MDLLGDFGKAGGNAQQPHRARGRESQGGQTPPLLLARLPASPTRCEEVVREKSSLSSPRGRDEAAGGTAVRTGYELSVKARSDRTVRQPWRVPERLPPRGRAARP
jgi:hypothetical protein